MLRYLLEIDKTSYRLDQVSQDLIGNSVTEESILGKAQTGDELKPGELPDRQSPFDLRAMGRRFSATYLPSGKAAFAMPL